MIRSKLLVGTVAALAMGIAAPAFAHPGPGGGTTTNNNNSFNTSKSKSTSDSGNTSVSVNLSSQRTGNIHLVADQSLDASISNHDPLNFNGKKSNYSSGSNSVNGSAFAAYSGILNQAWNTGINSNAQAATNMAAQGSTTFTTH